MCRNIVRALFMGILGLSLCPAVRAVERVQLLSIVQPGDDFVDVKITGVDGEVEVKLQQVSAEPLQIPAVNLAANGLHRFHLARPFSQSGRYKFVINGVDASEFFVYARSGDANLDLEIDISDSIYLLQYQFLGGDPPCFPHSDVNGDEILDLSDPLYLLAHFFSGGTGPKRVKTGAEQCLDGPGSTSCLEAMIADLGNTFNYMRASYAYKALYSQGEAAVPALVEAAAEVNVNNLHISFEPYPDEVSFHRPASLRLVTIYLLLAEAIRIQAIRPFFEPEISGENGFATDDELQQAVGAYQEWVLENIEGGFIGAPDPLGSLAVTWPVLFQVAPGNPEGVREPNSETPDTQAGYSRSCRQAVKGRNGGKWTEQTWCLAQHLPPGFIGPPNIFYQYNCASWALGCITSTVLNPTNTGGDKKDFEDMLEEHGYDPTSASETPPAPGDPNNKILVVFHVPLGGDCDDTTIIHLMKQKDDGKWTSKNGIRGPRYNCIEDPKKFVDKHYPAPPGKTTKIKYYCPKTP